MAKIGRKATKKEMESEAAIAVLSAVTPPGVTWTIAEMPEITGVERNTLHSVMTRAMVKLRNHAKRDPKLSQLLRDSHQRKEFRHALADL